MRKRRAVKRDVLADPIYNSKLVTKLINTIMVDGKKGVAQTILYDAFEMVKEKTNKEYIESLADMERYFHDLNDDLNTSSAITVMFDTIKADINGGTKLKLLEMYDRVLGLDLLKDDNKYIDENLKKYILEKIEERNLAKKNKDFEKADKIRNELLGQGITLKDTREGTIFEI